MSQNDNKLVFLILLEIEKFLFDNCMELVRKGRKY